MRPEAAFVPGGLTWRQADERTTVAGDGGNRLRRGPGGRMRVSHLTAAG